MGKKACLERKHLSHTGIIRVGLIHTKIASLAGYVVLTLGKECSSATELTRRG